MFINFRVHLKEKKTTCTSAFSHSLPSDGGRKTSPRHSSDSRSVKCNKKSYFFRTRCVLTPSVTFATGRRRGNVTWNLLCEACMYPSIG
jgi:hypothetical protein